MRIAILTLPLHVNFGGILQCYALQTVLERMGHEVSVLNTDFVNVDYKTRIRLFIKRLVKTCIGKESKFYGWKTEREITQKYTQVFIRKHIHLLNVQDLSLLKEDDFDAIVVGSDQIWRPMYYQPIANAYLKFAKDWTSIKRIAYATSFGTDKWEYTHEETQECASLVKLFDAVSVRENSAVDLCRKYLEVEAVQVLDPTLLLSKEDYLKLIDQSKLKKNEGVFTYFLDVTSSKMDLANRIAKERGLKLYQFNNPNVDCLSLHFEKRIQQPIEEWIAGFRDASFVVTDSFHGCVFSIIFNKPFVVIGNEERGIARLKSLLSMLDFDYSVASNIHQLQKIEWNKTKLILDKYRQISLSFLGKVQ